MTDYDESPTLSPNERLTPEAEAELAEALRAAFRPEPLSPERQRELVELALEDPFAPPNEDELRASERLRRALEEGDETHPDALLARALRAAAAPEAESPPVAATGAKARSRGNVVYASFGALALAAAAAFALFILRPQSKETAAFAPAAPAAGKAVASRPALAQSRTTAALFEAPFEPGTTTARIDRIALSRGRELRENRYVAWGVR